MKRISFVIPVFRNQGSIQETYGRLRTLMEGASDLSWEVCFVDDGSDDGSPEELQRVAEAAANVRVVTFSRNFGQVAAVTAGLREVSGDAAIVLSADLQEPIEKVEEMIRCWRRGSQVVICYRQSRSDPPVARWTSRVFYWLIHLSLPQMPPTGFDFFLLDRRPLDILNQFEERNRFFQGDVLWLGFPTTMLPYSRLQREIGVSQWSLGKKLKYFIDGLIGTSYWPIRLMSALGIATFGAGALYSGIIVYGWFTHRTPFVGWAPIMVAVLGLGGLNMLMLGVLGEYLWRTYDEVRGRPRYIVRERFTRDGAARE